MTKSLLVFGLIQTPQAGAASIAAMLRGAAANLFIDIEATERYVASLVEVPGPEQPVAMGVWTMNGQAMSQLSSDSLDSQCAAPGTYVNFAWATVGSLESDRRGVIRCS